MVVAKISTVNIDGKILFSKNLVVWFILKNCLVCSIMQSLSLRLIRGGRTESLRRLEQLLSVCLIAMFIISVIILAFAVKQIMTARGRLPFHLLLRKFLIFFLQNWNKLTQSCLFSSMNCMRKSNTSKWKIKNYMQRSSNYIPNSSTTEHIIGGIVMNGSVRRSEYVQVVSIVKKNQISFISSG